MSTRPTKRFVIWVNYHTEGWQPVEFDDAEQMRQWILGAQSLGSEFVVTRLLDVRFQLQEL
jgi:hypothetical protein